MLFLRDIHVLQSLPHEILLDEPELKAYHLKGEQEINSTHTARQAKSRDIDSNRPL